MWEASAESTIYSLIYVVMYRNPAGWAGASARRMKLPEWPQARSAMAKWQIPMPQSSVDSLLVSRLKKSTLRPSAPAAARQGCEAVDILGALGGRMDHAIGNIQLMYQFFCQGMEVNIYDARNRLYLLGGHKVFHREEVYGKYISFLPMTETVEGLTLRGFKYPLQRRTIGLGTSLCISNELKREEGILELERGVLLCVEAHD